MNVRRGGLVFFRLLVNYCWMNFNCEILTIGTTSLVFKHNYSLVNHELFIMESVADILLNSLELE